MSVSVQSGATLTFDKFWRWLKQHVNCILRAGSAEVWLFDQEAYHWHLDEDPERNPTVQLVWGKNLVGEMSLACGYLGMIEGLRPTEPITGSAYDLPFALPMTLADALALLRSCKPLVELFGKRFVAAYGAVKENEYETFSRVISSWEREHLLLNV